MEISVQFLTGFPHKLLFHKLYSHFPIIPPLSSSTSRATTSQSATIIKEQTHTVTGAVTAPGRRRTKSYLAREAAILQLQQASDLNSSLERLGGILKVQDLNVILRHFGNQSRWHDLSQLFDWMQQHGKTSVSSYSSYIKFLGKSLKPLKALEFYNSITDESAKINVFICNSILSCLVRNGKFDSSIKLFDKMKQNGLAPDAVTYNTVLLTTLLKVYVRGGLFERSRELLAELDTLGYAEEEMPYCTLMDGLSKAGHLDEARAIFRELQEKRVKSDGYAHSIMISALCRGGLFEEAKQLAGHLEAKFDKYDLVLLNTMLCAYCRAGEMENVMHIMRKIDELAISPDYNTFNILIKYFCKEKLYLLAYRTMEDMHSKGYQPEEELCSSLIYHLGVMRAHSEAFSVYGMLRYNKRTMCKALHEKILHILIAGRLLKDAYIVVKDNAGSISSPAIRKFASAFIRFGNINLVNDVVKVIHRSGYKIDQGLFHTAISRYITEPEKKELLLQLLQWMPGQGYVVDSSTRNLILKNSHFFGRQLIADILSKQHMMSKSLRSPRA